MQSKLLVPALAGVLLCLTACDIEDFGGFERYSRDFHYNYPLKAGGRLSVETFNGSVEVSTWDQDTVDISGTKTGRNQDAVEMLKVSIDNSPDSVSIRVVRPSERHNNLGARFVIKVPRKAFIDRITTSNGAIRVDEGLGPSRLRTSNGSIRVQSLSGNLDAQTSNSAIDLIEVAGDVIAHSSNGHIRAERVSGSLDVTTSNSGVNAVIANPDATVHAQTSNGSVELALPARFSASLRASTSNSSITLRFPSEPNAHLIASTSNSSITSDFDARVRGEIAKNHMDAELGAGGPTIEVHTSNGPIRLLKSMR